MSCIFANSKYYKQAKANPLDIAPPLGSQFLNNKTKHQHIKINAGDLVMRQVFDKPHYKILAHKKLPKPQFLNQYLKISDVTRKNQYLPATFIDFMRNQFPKQIYLAISRQFVPYWKPQYSMVQLSQILRNPRIDPITHIQNYSLSRYIFLCQGSDPWKMKFLHQFLNRRILQYPIDCQVINHNDINQLQFMVSPSQNTVFEPPTDVLNVEQVKKLIQNINQTNKKKDPLYSGVHVYFSDFRDKRELLDYFERQTVHYPLLQYYITVMSGVLGNGQTAIIKLCGSFKHKTFQFLFLLKLMFNGKVSICKTLGSNPFLPDSYIICEYFNKQNGDIIHKYLLQNYHLLGSFNDNKLLLDPAKILKQDMHTNLRNFNENIIHKGIQYHLKQYKNNSNVQYYPSKQKIIQRLPTFAIDLNDIVKDMIKLPDKNTQAIQLQKEGQSKSVPKVQQTSIQAPKTSILSGGLFAKKKVVPNKDKKQTTIL